MLPELPSIDRRLHVAEWMDGPCSADECARCLEDLHKVNRLLFAYRPTLNWLDKFACRPGSILRIVDVGCGAGDMLRRIEVWAAERRLPVQLIGIDRNAAAIDAARLFTETSSAIEWICCDVSDYRPSSQIDLIMSSLVAHHLEDDEIVRFLEWMERTAMRGWFINDLERALMPYYGFKLLSRVMGWHPYVQHDGPVSILRSFLSEDWLLYADKAGIHPELIRVFRARPGRLCVSRVKQ